MLKTTINFPWRKGEESAENRHFRPSFGKQFEKWYTDPHMYFKMSAMVDLVGMETFLKSISQSVENLWPKNRF